MPAEHLPVYLNDHFAGAEAALDILDYLEQSHPHTPAGAVATELRTQIEDDRAQLERILALSGKSVKTPRAVVGWISEKILELKLKLDDPSDGSLRLLESIELLSLGIEGKRSLWVVLQDNAQQVEALAGVNYALLIQRADAQRALVEAARVAAARVAFAPS